MEEEEVKDGADEMQLTTCLLQCHLSCNCRRENVVIIVVVVDDGTDDRRRPRQGSTLFEKTKHRNTAVRSQVPQSVISGLQRRRRQRPTVFARSRRQACSVFAITNCRTQRAEKICRGCHSFSGDIAR
ncbi:unnamed protein product [Lasius platythorax]|uniref:Uncharacterized protein n=1 Tax=Lasius platythorax TaxID=488582 RepID=A0AAV2NKC8_9HYME